MPRGTRAYFGAEVLFHHHAHGGAELSVITAVFDWLPVSCWCQMVAVLATQREVTEGLTRSCGRPDCHRPGWATGEPVMLGVHLLQPNMEGMSHEDALRRFGDDLSVVAMLATPADRRARVKNVERPIREARKQSHFARVAARRDQVEMLWNSGRSLKSIAALLDEAFHTISGDVAFLRRKGRVFYRYSKGGAA